MDGVLDVVDRGRRHHRPVGRLRAPAPRAARVRVLEAGDRPGGVIRTERFDGWVVDCGPDALLAQKPAGVGLCRELGIASRLVSTLPPRTAYVLRDDPPASAGRRSFLGFPLSSRRWRCRRSSRRAARPAWRPRSWCRGAWHEDDDESIGAFVRRRFGQEAADYLADPLLAGIHAGDADGCRCGRCFPGCGRRAPVGQRAARVPRDEDDTLAPGRVRLAAGRHRRLVEALARRSRPARCALARGSRDAARAAVTGRVERRSCAAARRGALRARLRRRRTAARARHRRGGGLRRHPYASTATVAFGYRPIRWRIRCRARASWSRAPSAARCSPARGSARSGRGARPTGTCCCAGSSAAAAIRIASSGTTTRRSSRRPREARGLLGITGSPLSARLSRWPRQSPQFVVGHQARVAAMEQRLKALPGLFLAGSGFRAIGIPDCIADGRAATASTRRRLPQAQHRGGTGEKPR